MSKLVLLLTLTLMTTHAALAGTESYQADIDGMVCAFCAYNVGKRITALPGVVAGTVDVDLDAGQLRFDARTDVSEHQIAAALNDSGFSINALRTLESAAVDRPQTEPTLKLALSFEAADATRFESILDALGSLAITIGGRLSIQAPAELEIELLKPLLAGKKHSIKVAFDATDDRSVGIQLLVDSVVVKSH